MELKDYIRNIQDYPKKGILFRDITTLLQNKDAFKYAIDKMAEQISSEKIEYIVGAESRGFLIGSALAYKLNCGFIPVRKKGKLPPTTVKSTFEYVKEYGKDELELPKLINNEEYKDKNFYIIDDIYATGNTVQSLKKEIENLGGNVVGISVVINIKELNNDELFSILDVNEE